MAITPLAKARIRVDPGSGEAKATREGVGELEKEEKKKRRRIDKATCQDIHWYLDAPRPTVRVAATLIFSGNMHFLKNAATTPRSKQRVADITVVLDTERHA